MAITPGIKGRKTALVSLVALATLTTIFEAVAHGTTPSLASVDVFDRTSGESLVVYEKNGQRFVVGTPGHEYSIRIRNQTQGRILAVTSIDGVNVITGDTASPSQSGYVIAVGDDVDISGWRRSLSQTSAFYFTELGDSYAARTGRPRDVGVIGVALFEERRPIAVEQSLRDIAGQREADRQRAELLSARPQSEARLESFNGPPEARGDAERSTQGSATTFASKLGTGFGRDETSYAWQAQFERATRLPVQTIAIRYDRRENLAAMGVLPAPRYAQRTPDPFPSLRFVPPPR
jgi:hypothetical protein